MAYDPQAVEDQAQQVAQSVIEWANNKAIRLTCLNYRSRDLCEAGVGNLQETHGRTTAPRLHGGYEHHSG